MTSGEKNITANISKRLNNVRTDITGPTCVEEMQLPNSRKPSNGGVTIASDVEKRHCLIKKIEYW
jgi:hypothetical protein